MEAPTARWKGGRQDDRPAGGRQAPPNIKAEVLPTPAFAANNIHRVKKERRGVREGVATAKSCRIPHLSSAGKLRMNPLIL